MKQNGTKKIRTGDPTQNVMKYKRSCGTDVL